ncbi:DDE superfamily endonuclease [Nitrosomonas communis]|uniref:DDE superfamily endonuclease n=2 Tax=Nitrosomonas communis TaxID=44574 RepID=A0A1I4QTM1_9PROT|nr:DDE superfamily endonuclease [Nitrosomonas communis]
MLPPYSPELNPVENLWDELREKSFHNRVFDSLGALENHLEAAPCATWKKIVNVSIPSLHGLGL